MRASQVRVRWVRCPLLRHLFRPLQVKSSDEAVILCKTAVGALKLNIGDLQATKVSSRRPRRCMLERQPVLGVSHQPFAPSFPLPKNQWRKCPQTRVSSNDKKH